jgi:hypothetical protein
MKGKMWLYAGLLVLILALMGAGIWYVLTPKDKVTIPESDPVIVMDISLLSEEKQSQLSIYDDGTIIRWEDIGLQEITGDSYIRTWRTGKIGTQDIKYIFDYLNSVDFDGLDKTYLAPDITDESVTITDEYCKITADNGTIDNSVIAYGYFTAGNNDPFTVLPSPINKIYGELKDYIDNNTEEVLVEELTY